MLLAATAIYNVTIGSVIPATCKCVFVVVAVVVETVAFRFTFYYFLFFLLSRSDIHIYLSICEKLMYFNDPEKMMINADTAKKKEKRKL